MAARRLIIIMLILLGISTLLAAALPDRVRDAEEEQTASEATAGPAETTGNKPTETDEQASTTRRLKPETIDADKDTIVVIKLEAGQQLPLTVLSSTDDLVEIQKIGFVDAVGPHKPATFDILTDLPGEYGIKLLETGRIIGRLEITQRAPEGSKPASTGDRP